MLKNIDYVWQYKEGRDAEGDRFSTHMLVEGVFDKFDISVSKKSIASKRTKKRKVTA